MRSFTQAPPSKNTERQTESARSIVSLFGGLLSGFIALFFFLAAPLFGVTLLPTATFPYGTLLSVLHLIKWLLCLLSVLFTSRALLTFTFLTHVVSTGLDLVMLVLISVFAYSSIITASSSALQYGFVLVPLIIQFIVAIFVTAALWRLLSLFRR